VDSTIEVDARGGLSIGKNDGRTILTCHQHWVNMVCNVLRQTTNDKATVRISAVTEIIVSQTDQVLSV
jgi:hypothetical protein